MVTLLVFLSLAVGMFGSGATTFADAGVSWVGWRRVTPMSEQPEPPQCDSSSKKGQTKMPMHHHRTLREHLGLCPEPQPDWLRCAERLSSREVTQHFLSSRVLFYPGAGSDGGPIACFNSARACHSFLYVDYASGNRQQIISKAQQDIRGYRSVVHFDLRLDDLVPSGWLPHSTVDTGRQSRRSEMPYGFLEVLEREREQPESHGAERFALMYLGADGFATYDALFCQPASVEPPWCVVLQDHGFGGNYDRFGSGGILNKLAEYSNWPPFLLIGEGTLPWEGYAKVPDILPEPMGMHGHARYLWRSSRS